MERVVIRPLHPANLQERFKLDLPRVGTIPDGRTALDNRDPETVANRGASCFTGDVGATSDQGEDEREGEERVVAVGFQG